MARIPIAFPAALEAEARDLAAREAQCCAFLTLAVSCGDDAVVLTITGPLMRSP